MRWSEGIENFVHIENNDGNSIHTAICYLTDDVMTSYKKNINNGMYYCTDSNGYESTITVEKVQPIEVKYKVFE